MGNRRGQTLALAYVTIVVLAILGGSFFSYSITVHQHSQIQQARADIFYLAEGGLEDASSRFATAIANFQIDANAARYPTTGSLITTFSASSSLPTGATASSVIVQAEPSQRTVTQPDGTLVFLKNYLITTTVQHPTALGTTVTLNQIITRQLISTFQHAVFYDGDLEWLPGAVMSLSGRVHTNSDMYLGTGGTGIVLTVDSTYVNAAGSIYNRRKDGGALGAGSIVQIKDTVSGNYVAMNGYDSTAADWVTGSQTRWGGTVQTGATGATKLAAPVVGSIQSGGYYDTNADVKITNNNGTITITKAGVPASVPTGTVTNSTTFYNNREGKWVQMVNIDMKKLAGYANPSDSSPTYPNNLPSNGLLYVTETNIPSSYQPGVRLVSGQQIYRTGGVTVVTNDPIYMQGDYNTVSKQPSSVMADAVNLLSNNWGDSNSSQTLSTRTPTATTVNAAFIGGITTTTTGNYNGGLENYPRLHENWNGDASKPLTITGSFVSLWNSQIATGQWIYGGSYYTAPKRVWSYDSTFSSGTLPPFTPWAVQMTKGAWWKQ